MKKTKDAMLKFRITSEQLEKLDQKLESEGYTTRSEWFNQILREYLKGVDKK